MIILIFGVLAASIPSNGLLTVQRNEVREFDSLDGIWTFVREPRNDPIGLRNKWNKKDLSKFENATVMPVPSSYNDLGISSDLRDHVGWVWYQTKYTLNHRDHGRKLVLRFGSVNYYAAVFVNGDIVGRHEGGHLPFEIDVTRQIKRAKDNIITVAVNNTLTLHTLPTAEFTYFNPEISNLTNGETIQRLPNGHFSNVGYFDFFNYAGIMRSVHLLKLPKTHITKVLINAEYTGYFDYEISTTPKISDDLEVDVKIFDPSGKQVYCHKGHKNIDRLKDPQLWWPRGMGAQNLYEIRVTLRRAVTEAIIDIYKLTFGFRTVSYTRDQILINQKAFYCLGFGMHEEANIRGRAYDPVMMTKDLNLFEWTGANCYRTTHYPYSEERMYENDRRGIAVIVETPAVGQRHFYKENLDLHLRMVRDMIARDRNHPSVIMWSMANEPHTQLNESRPYFKALIDEAHRLDHTRPVTIVYGPTDFRSDKTPDLVDVICVNRYYGWYRDFPFVNVLNQSTYWYIRQWKHRYWKPIMYTEYGAESIPGISQEPSIAFSAQYQNEVLHEHHVAFDRLRKEKLLAGEMAWVFADFMTAPTLTRVVGNHKGMFTRDRQPKPAAYLMRERYQSLLNQTNNEIW